ncbi:hypothetical protein M0812_07870 [Anaeramoeba flamelloides]|uniref:Uncharacterized protein n=1 Tax=Anaeramoeba flamelloides TaxID=1746091 RepID=A0AAV8A444_9EUKA|nr:hypothetical protein M0812_07870 [Anaeramoeba flamelloides]
MDSNSNSIATDSEFFELKNNEAIVQTHHLNKQYCRLFNFLKNWNIHGLNHDKYNQDLKYKDKQKLKVPPGTIFEYFCFQNNKDSENKKEKEKLVQIFKSKSDKERREYKDQWIGVWDEFRTKFENTLSTKNQFLSDNPFLYEDLDESDLPIWLFNDEVIFFFFFSFDFKDYVGNSTIYLNTF